MTLPSASPDTTRLNGRHNAREERRKNGTHHPLRNLRHMPPADILQPLRHDPGRHAHTSVVRASTKLLGVRGGHRSAARVSSSARAARSASPPSCANRIWANTYCW